MQGVSNTDFENYVKDNDVLSTLPSQTVANPREHVNAITTRSGKTCEGPSTPLVPTFVVSTPQKEPKQDPETSMEKVQKSGSESTGQVPPPEDHDPLYYNSKPNLRNCSRAYFSRILIISNQLDIPIPERKNGKRE
ncbi:hypothetical protein Tco_0143591 [Tanacetum coccineum]